MHDKLNPNGTLRIAVFASGKGSNFQAILDAIRSGKIPNAHIAVVISNNSAAGALERARANEINAVHLSRLQFDADKTFNDKLLETLAQHSVNFIVLAGYMKKLDASVIRKFKNRIINIHPALLPKFGGQGMYGMRVHEAVIANKETISGATVHIVDEEYDHGAIVLQKTVEIFPDDTAEHLAEKVLNIEHELYPEAVRLIAEGKIKVNGTDTSL